MRRNALLSEGILMLAPIIMPFRDHPIPQWLCFFLHISFPNPPSIDGDWTVETAPKRN
jgi:hypothetical protein